LVFVDFLSIRTLPNLRPSVLTTLFQFSIMTNLDHSGRSLRLLRVAGARSHFCVRLAEVDGRCPFPQDRVTPRRRPRPTPSSSTAASRKGPASTSRRCSADGAGFRQHSLGEGLDFALAASRWFGNPRNPMAPTVHANFRYITKGDRSWFGGGADLTPYYPYREGRDPLS